MNVDTSLGSRVRRAREARGLGLNEAARLSRIAPQKLADAESGADSRASTIAAIARGLGVSADYLLGLAPEEPRLLEVNAATTPPEGDVPGDLTVEELARMLARTNRRQAAIAEIVAEHLPAAQEELRRLGLL